MGDKIFLSSPHMSDEGYEQEFVKEAFDTNWIAPLGANVNGFEKEICEHTGAKAAAAVTSGTAAMHLALKLAEVKEGDTVFCQSLTFSATVNPIIYERAKPVFIDSDIETWNMSPAALKKAFEKYPDTKIVIPVHLYGMAANIEEIQKICDEHGAVMIEDAAESLGTLYKGRSTGTFGRYGVFSFNGNKIITTSGGGMLVCNAPDAKEQMDKARFWSTQSKEPMKHYEHKEIGYNYRMSNIVAGIGRGQLKVLDLRVEQKRHIYEYYMAAFKDIDDITMMPIHDDYSYCNCWLSCMTIDEACDLKPDDIMNALQEDDIEARPVWKPMHRQPVFKGYDYIDNGGVADRFFAQGVCLPSDTKMTDDDLERITDIIRGLWNRK